MNKKNFNHWFFFVIILLTVWSSVWNNCREMIDHRYKVTKSENELAKDWLQFRHGILLLIAIYYIQPLEWNVLAVIVLIY